MLDKRTVTNQRATIIEKYICRFLNKLLVILPEPCLLLPSISTSGKVCANIWYLARYLLCDSIEMKGEFLNNQCILCIKFLHGNFCYNCEKMVPHWA